MVKDAVSKFSRPVYMVCDFVDTRNSPADALHYEAIGGLHLAGADLADRIPPTVNFLANQLKPAPAYVLPMHCSGFSAKVALEAALGEGCVPAGVGIKVEVQGDPEGERMIFTPIIE